MKTGKKILSLVLVVLMFMSVVAMSPKASASNITYVGGWERTQYFDSPGLVYSLCSGYHWDWKNNEYVKVHDVLSGALNAPVEFYKYYYYDENGNYIYSMHPSDLILDCENYDDCPTSVTVSGAASCRFSSCEKLESVNLSSIIYQINFYNCPKLKELTLSTGTIIHVDDCDGLEKFSFCNNEEAEKWVSIEDCDALGIVEIKSDANNVSLKNCPNLTRITLPDSVKNYEFDNCKNLEYVKLSDIAIPAYIFENHTKLETVIIPEGVPSIGDCAFRFCSNLKSINIPESVKEIGLQAFSFTGLGDIYFAGTKAQWKEITEEFYSDVFPNGTTVHCSDGIYDMCTCKCHNNAFMKFLYKIISTIRDLFGLYSHCECGWTHTY